MNAPVNKNKIIVTLEPIGRRQEIDAGETALSAAQRAGLEVMAACGGNGSCGMCKFTPISGKFSPITKHEQELLQKTEDNPVNRLACRTRILTDATLHFPPESLGTLQRLQLESQLSDVSVDPIITSIDIDIPLQEVTDNSSLEGQAKENAVRGYASGISIPEEMNQPLMRILEQHNGRAMLVIRDHQVIAVLPPGSQLIGFALDIGTTKIAAFLVDLRSGRTLASGGVINPQIAYGEDVINRIKYADENPEGDEKLHTVLINAINELLGELCGQLGIDVEHIVDGVIVGNTVMHHIILRLPVHCLGSAPYTTTYLREILIPAAEIGIHITPRAMIYLPPNVAGFIGGDHIAALVSINTLQPDDTALIIDIGTNTEISLIHNKKHLACSCASGPAFEGAHIREGLRAIPGAIERLVLENDVIHFQTIQHKPPIGICGSGIVDAIAELRKERIIDHRGVLNKNDPRVKNVAGRTQFIIADSNQTELARDITLDRKDINQIQLAKAAIRSGIEVLLREARITPDDIERVFLAGAFGTYLNITNAVRLGMFPPIPINRFEQIGNAAGKGAREMLISAKKRREAGKLPEGINYLELTTVQDYVDVYMNAIGFN